VRRLVAVQGPQFGEFGQHAQSRELADAGDGFEFLYPCIQDGRLCAQGGELGFDLFQVPFQPVNQALGLTAQGRQGEPFSLESLRDEDFQNLHPAPHQLGQLLFLFRAGRSGFGLQCLAISGEDGGIDVIGLWRAGLGHARSSAPGPVQDAHRNFGGLEAVTTARS